ncbi:hypothetical protein Tco_0000270 [Tanacetum coccineum]
MSLRAHLLSAEIREEVPEVPESSLKLDGGVAARVSKEGATLYARLIVALYQVYDGLDLLPYAMAWILFVSTKCVMAWCLMTLVLLPGKNASIWQETRELDNNIRINKALEFSDNIVGGDMERGFLNQKGSEGVEGVTPSMVDMDVEKEKLSSLEDTTVLGSFPPLPTSIDGLDAMLENGLWFIQNNPLILKKWHPNENLLKEDVSTVPVRIMQISQENGQNRTNTDTRRKRVYKSRGFDSKKGQKSTPVNL